MKVLPGGLPNIFMNLTRNCVPKSNCHQEKYGVSVLCATLHAAQISASLDGLLGATIPFMAWLALHELYVWDCIAVANVIFLRRILRSENDWNENQVIKLEKQIQKCNIKKDINMT